MAKSTKADPSRSLVGLAFEAFEQGDAVQARALAQAVLAGREGPDEAKVAKALAQTLSAAGHEVEPTPTGVAKDLLSRTIVPPKPYLFVGAVAATFIGLVLLAVFRY